MGIDTTDRKKLTYEDYALIPDDGCLHEIIDGEHFVNAAPNLYHQTISRRLQFILYSQIEQKNLGVVFNAPCDVEISSHDIVQPDLVIVLNQNSEILTPAKIVGTPDMIVEILSTSTSVRDRRFKRSRYQKAGVPEYWIVDPFERNVEQLVLQDGVYEALPNCEVLQLTILENVTVRLEDVW